jgi:hypothetical protein
MKNITAKNMMNRKPLGKKTYGSIPHLPNSRLGPSDKQANPGHVRIATKKVRDKHDLVSVTEKLDGSNVAVAKINGVLLPLSRAGYLATTSPYEQHHYWHAWVMEHYKRFDEFLNEGEWVSGEWCIQAHSTRYDFPRSPWFVIDIFREGKRISQFEVTHRVEIVEFEEPKLLAYGPHSNGLIPPTFNGMLAIIENHPFGFHGAIDPIEGFVYRVERKGEFDFLCKYVRPDKQDGIYLVDEHGNQLPPTWNIWGDRSKSIRRLPTIAGCNRNERV